MGNDVFIGTGATLLGPITVGSNVKIGAGAFIHMRDVPDHCTAVGAPARIVRRSDQSVDEELPTTRLSDASIAVEIPEVGRVGTGG